MLTQNVLTKVHEKTFSILNLDILSKLRGNTRFLIQCYHLLQFTKKKHKKFYIIVFNKY